MPALVRNTATKSPGCIWVSTHFLRDCRTLTLLSNESPRSSTTSAIVRRICSELTVHASIEEEVFYPEPA